MAAKVIDILHGFIDVCRLITLIVGAFLLAVGGLASGMGLAALFLVKDGASISARGLACILISYLFMRIAGVPHKEAFFGLRLSHILLGGIAIASVSLLVALILSVSMGQLTIPLKSILTIFNRP